MGGTWQHLVDAGLLRDLLALAVAHIVAIPHVVIWLVHRRRKQRSAST